MREIDRNSPVPLYYQIAEEIRRRILSGELEPGQRLEPERLASEEFDVSRMTLRHSIQYLTNLGLVEAKRGSGTFVAEPKFTHYTLAVSGFEEEVRKQGGTVTSKVLYLNRYKPSTDIRAFLRLSEEDEVYAVVRLRLADDIPMLLERSYLPAALCPGLERFDLSDQSLYATLHNEYGIALSYSDNSLEVGKADAYEASVLEISEGQAVLLLNSVTFDMAGSPVEYAEALYRGDKVKVAFSSKDYNRRSLVNVTLSRPARRNHNHTEAT